MQGPRLQQASNCKSVCSVWPQHSMPPGGRHSNIVQQAMQLTHGSPLRKQATSACLVKRQSQETKPDPLLATRVRGTLTQPGCVPMPAKMKSPTPPSMKECLPKPKSFSGRMTLLRKVSFASLGPWGRAAPAQQHLLRASCAAAGGLGECVTKSAANAGHCFFKLALRCSTGTLHDHSADPPAAMVQQQGTAHLKQASHALQQQDTKLPTARPGWSQRTVSPQGRPSCP